MDPSDYGNNVDTAEVDMDLFHEAELSDISDEESTHHDNYSTAPSLVAGPRNIVLADRPSRPPPKDVMSNRGTTGTSALPPAGLTNATGLETTSGSTPVPYDATDVTQVTLRGLQRGLSAMNVILVILDIQTGTISGVERPGWSDQEPELTKYKLLTLADVLTSKKEQNLVTTGGSDSRATTPPLRRDTSVTPE